MTWFIENGKTVEGALRAHFDLSDLSAGMKVQIVKGSSVRKLMQATILRVHSVTCHGSGSIDPNKDCTSDDGGPITEECELFRDTCVHVKFRNGVKVVVDCLPLIRPLDDAVVRLAEIEA
jgi:hypothetical protein